MWYQWTRHQPSQHISCELQCCLLSVKERHWMSQHWLLTKSLLICPLIMSHSMQHGCICKIFHLQIPHTRLQAGLMSFWVLSYSLSWPVVRTKKISCCRGDSSVWMGDQRCHSANQLRAVCSSCHYESRTSHTAAVLEDRRNLQPVIHTCVANMRHAGWSMNLAH